MVECIITVATNRPPEATGLALKLTYSAPETEAGCTAPPLGLELAAIILVPEVGDPAHAGLAYSMPSAYGWADARSAFFKRISNALKA